MRAASAFRVHGGRLERTQEEVFDDLLQEANSHERMGAVVDVRQPYVTHVLGASSAERRHELIGQQDVHLGVDHTVNQ
jgi:hypothetical protein